MRHNKKFNHLSRKKAHRDSLLANMTISLIMHKRIFTTLAKAKALRMYAEPLINRAKQDSTANRRVVFAELQNKEAVTELFREIAQKIANRPAATHVSSRQATVLVTTPRPASSSSLTTTKTCSMTSLPKRLLAPVVHVRVQRQLRLPQRKTPQQKLPQLSNSQAVISYIRYITKSPFRLDVRSRNGLSSYICLGGIINHSVYHPSVCLIYQSHLERNVVSSCL